MNLRPYQRAGLDATIAALDRRPILALPTGGGKTFTAAQLILETGRRTLWLAHRRELILQAAGAIAKLGLDVGAIMPGIEPRPKASVQVASIQTLRRRTAPAAELVIVDECHHARARTYRDVLGIYPGVPIVGLTATPFRLDGQGLGDIFGEIVVGAYADDLCADGTLIEPVVYAPDVPDMTGVELKNGDFNCRQAATRMTKAKLIGDIVQTWKQRAPGARTVVYATNVEHSRQIERAFKAAGVRVEHLDGNTPKAQRDAILHRLRIGYTTIVCNVGVLEEGWDLPALDCAIIARPSGSLAWHLQVIGRIMRGAEGKRAAIVLDHAGNHLRHGPVTQRITYSLADRVGDRRGGGDDASSCKRCPKCFRVVARSAPACPECKHVFTGKEVQHSPGELVRFDGEKFIASRRPPIEELQAAWDALERERATLGQREGWSFLRFEQRFGFKPLVWNGAVCDPATAGEDVRRGVYDRLEQLARTSGRQAGWVSHEYRRMFGEWPRFTRSVAS